MSLNPDNLRKFFDWLMVLIRAGPPKRNPSTLSGSAKPHRSLPHKRQQQEEEGDDRQDIHQRAEGLISLGQLGQRGAVGSETGQQEVRHKRF
jgi:hypothetical protein